jgi:hypothetical protein
MKRHVAYTIMGSTIVLLLAACGGGGASNANKTATARTADANDAATVTAFAGRGQTSVGGTTTGAPAGTAVSGKAGGFKFATLAPAGTPRGTAAGAGSAGATPSGTRAAGSSVAGRSGTPAGVQGNTYTDPQGRYTLQIPQGWRVQQTGTADIDFQAAPTSLKGAFQIAAEEIGTGLTIDDYAIGTMESIRQSVDSYQEIAGGIQQTTISGMPARRFDFSGMDGTTTLRAAVFVVKKGTTAYGFLIAADPADFDAVYAQAKQFIDTFAFL